MVKKILIGVAGLIVLLLLIGFLLPGKMEMSRSMTINAPAEYSFEQVNTLPNWKNWSYWSSLDTTMEVTYGEPSSGVGSWYSWKSESMGTGKLTITESIPYKSIKADLDFMENGTAKAWYTFEPDGEATKLTMGFNTDFGMNPIMRLMGATMMEGEMNKSFDYNLAKIKGIVENMPKYSVKISEENVSPVSYVGLSKTLNPQNNAVVTAEIGKMFEELVNTLKKAKVEASGNPFCIFPKFEQQSMEVVAALPVPPDAKLPAKYPVAQTVGGKAVKAVHLGSYDKLETTHNDIHSYVSAKKLEINGAPWEIYLTDPFAEKDTAKWITEVYYPVK